ncbi:MAG: Sec-independent protein translocase protein TatB [Xanthobacteraceae bacterium]|jgi:sec-independent protein translocase protein TatB
MFDISWTEFLLIGIVALIVIGPKELPAVMRGLGQWTRKIRSLAADFQNQFHEAMREAEMADLKKQVDDVAQDIKQYDPLKDVRADVEAIGKDLDAAPDKNSEEKSSEKELSKETAPESPAAAAPAKELPIPEAATELRDKEIVGAGVAPEAAAEASSPDGNGRAR